MKREEASTSYATFHCLSLHPEALQREILLLLYSFAYIALRQKFDTKQWNRHALTAKACFRAREVEVLCCIRGES